MCNYTTRKFYNILDLSPFYGGIATAFFTGMMERRNTGRLGRKAAKDPMFIRTPEPIIPTFQHDLIPSGA